MKFNLVNSHEIQEAKDQLNLLIEKQAIIELKKISPKRTLSQNSYLHVLLGAFGVEFGYTIEESKTIYKRVVNHDIYVYRKHGQAFLRSSADLSKEEMQKSIDRFIDYAAEQGLKLPAADDKELLMFMENKIEQQGAYL